jgi:hypothetical protein
MSSPRNARHGQQVPRRLAPIDHVRALYEGAVKSRGGRGVNKRKSNVGMAGRRADIQ